MYCIQTKNENFLVRVINLQLITKTQKARGSNWRKDGHGDSRDLAAAGFLLLGQQEEGWLAWPVCLLKEGLSGEMTLQSMYLYTCSGPLINQFLQPVILFSRQSALVRFWSKSSKVFSQQFPHCTKVAKGKLVWSAEWATCFEEGVVLGGFPCLLGGCVV